MPFPRIDFKLTDEQVQALDAFAKEISRDNSQNLIAEMFILPHDYRFKEVRVRLLDAITARSTQEFNRRAQDEYDARQDKQRRLKDLRDALEAQSITASVSNDVVVVHRGKHKYEMREVE